ncbi:hypothetical protein LX36DRAFT_101236 [Colletotrichum falcatum]|nr:hypothetical protein LX36DRAFT_101236 [Colletotrichum falcatum]
MAGDVSCASPFPQPFSHLHGTNNEAHGCQVLCHLRGMAILRGREVSMVVGASNCNTHICTGNTQQEWLAARWPSTPAELARFGNTIRPTRRCSAAARQGHSRLRWHMHVSNRDKSYPNLAWARRRAPLSLYACSSLLAAHPIAQSPPGGQRPRPPPRCQERCSLVLISIGSIYLFGGMWSIINY